MTRVIELDEPTAPDWRAIFSLSFGVIALMTSEFLPIGLLTPIATGLGVSQGAAGQAISVTAMAALASGLLVSAATRNISRRLVLLCILVLLIASDCLVALAPSLPYLLAARVLLGVGHGALWAMIPATAMRIAPKAFVPRALSIIFGGVSIAAIISAPLGSYLGGLIGWRGVFLLAAAPGAVALIWQFLALPTMPGGGHARFGTLAQLMRKPPFAAGIVGLFLVYAGHYAFLTYERPFLEKTSGVSLNHLSAILLGYGIAQFAGVLLAGFLLRTRLRTILTIVPLVMSALAIALITFGAVESMATVLIALWGFAYGMVPVSWNTWLTRTVSEESESGGGLLSATIQVGIASGAAIGGLAFDTHGAVGAFLASAMIMILAAAVVVLALRLQATEGARASHAATVNG